MPTLPLVGYGFSSVFNFSLWLIALFLLLCVVFCIFHCASPLLQGSKVCFCIYYMSDCSTAAGIWSLLLYTILNIRLLDLLLPGTGVCFRIYTECWVLQNLEFVPQFYECLLPRCQDLEFVPCILWVLAPLLPGTRICSLYFMSACSPAARIWNLFPVFYECLLPRCKDLEFVPSILWVLAPLLPGSGICSLYFMSACSPAARIWSLFPVFYECLLPRCQDLEFVPCILWVLAPLLLPGSGICSLYFMSACSHAARIWNSSTTGKLCAMCRVSPSSLAPWIRFKQL